MLSSPITRCRGCVGLWSVRCPGESQLEGQSGQTTYLIEFTKIDGGLTTVFTYLPFFFIHPPMISFQFDVFVSRYHGTPPHLCSFSRKKEKYRRISPRIIPLSILYPRTNVYPFRTHSKINFNADPEIALPHSFTVAERDNRSLRLSFCFH